MMDKRWCRLLTSDCSSLSGTDHTGGSSDYIRPIPSYQWTLVISGL